MKFKENFEQHKAQLQFAAARAFSKDFNLDYFQMFQSKMKLENLYRTRKKRARGMERSFCFFSYL